MTTAITSYSESSTIDVNGIPSITINRGGTSNTLYSTSATVAANALTVTLQPCVMKFRSATLSNGETTTVAINSPLTLTVPFTATLGTLANVNARLALVVLSNVGVPELAIVNLAGSVSLDEGGVISTTAMSATANAATVIYSAAARVDAPYKFVGLIETTQTVAGTWAAAPTLIRGASDPLSAMVSPFSRTVLDDVDAPAWRATLGIVNITRGQVLAISAGLFL